MIAVPAQLGARLLHGGNGAGRHHAGDRAAGGHVPVARDLLQFIDLATDDRNVNVAQRLARDGLDAVVSQSPVHMDKVPAQVRVFLLVHRAVRPDEVPGPGVGQHILQNGLIAPVHIFLGGLAHIDITEPAGAARRAEQGIKNKGVQPVVIPAPFPIAFLVLRGEQHRIPHELAVVQHRLGTLPFFVVPVDDGGFLRGVHPVLEHIAVNRLLNPQLSLQLGVLFQKQIVVPQPQVEDVSRLLDIRNAAVPVQIQYIDPPDGNIPQPVQLVGIPEHAVNARAGFQLVVHDPVIDLLKILLL